MTRHTKSSRSAFELSRVCVRWAAADTMDITRGEAFIDKRTIRIYSKVIQISNASGRRPQHRIACKSTSRDKHWWSWSRCRSARSAGMIVCGAVGRKSTGWPPDRKLFSCVLCIVYQTSTSICRALVCCGFFRTHSLRGRPAAGTEFGNWVSKSEKFCAAFSEIMMLLALTCLIVYGALPLSLCCGLCSADYRVFAKKDLILMMYSYTPKLMVYHNPAN